MFNLLSPSDLANTRQEYRRRLWVVSLLLLMAAFVSAILLLLPTVYSANLLRSRGKAELMEYKNKPESSDYAALAEDVKQTKSMLTAIKKDQVSKTEIFSVIKGIVVEKPTGVVIEGLVWTVGEDSTKILLAGETSSRDYLRSFVSNLEKTGKFASVDVPVSSFAKSQDAKFSISLSLKDLKK